MILDARRANRYFRRPPVALMVTGEGFSNVELDPAESDQRWFMASGDIRNAFRCLLVPPSLGRYFSLPALSAKAAGLVGRRVEGRTLSLSDLVSLFPASLPMSSRACTSARTQRIA